MGASPRTPKVRNGSALSRRGALSGRVPVEARDAVGPKRRRHGDPGNRLSSMKLQVSVTQSPRVLFASFFSYVLACGGDGARLPPTPHAEEVRRTVSKHGQRRCV